MEGGQGVSMEMGGMVLSFTISSVGTATASV